MLEYSWFAALMVVSIACAVQAARNADDPQWQIGSHSAALMAMAVSWDGVGAQLLAWLKHSLPQQGTEINLLTAYTIGVAIALLVVAVPAFAAMFAHQSIVDRQALRRT